MIPVHPEVPITNNESESLKMSSVLNLHRSDVSVWQHVVSVALSCKQPKRIQLEVSSWLAIAQCQQNSIKNRFNGVGGLACLYFGDTVLQGEFFISLDDIHVIRWCSVDATAIIFTFPIAWLVLFSDWLRCGFEREDCCN